MMRCARRWQWRGLAPAGLALLAACAAPVDGPGKAAGAGHRPGTPAFPGIEQSVRMQPLDATRLPPFAGEHRVVGEPASAIAGIDRTSPPDDLWQRVRIGFGMPDLDGPRVREKIAWYAARPDDLQRMLARAGKYLYFIVDELERRGMPTELALLPMVESSFNPLAYSRAHASGLWQFIPATGKRYALEQNWWYDGRRDLVASTGAALAYLNDIYELHGDWHLALASYNWGEGAVTRAIQKNQAENLPTDYASLAMPDETRNYVPKLQALKNIIADPRSVGIVLEPIPNRPYLASVTRSADIDVQLAAKLAEMPVEEFIELNSGFNRPLLRAEASPRIVLPADRVERFHANLSKHDGDTAVHWQVYHPRRGETLDAVASKHKLPVARLRQVNGIPGSASSAPALLVVPQNGAVLDPDKLPVLYLPPPNTGGVHVVRRGDTLWDIARRYDLSVADLRRWNDNPRVLRPGQRISLGGYGYASPRRAKDSPGSNSSK